MIDIETLENAKIVFGLEKQGHIPTIENMLVDGKNWSEIGQVIGWCPITAREHYERYSLRPKTIKESWFEDKDLICPLLARAVEMLRKIKNKPTTAMWDRNEISSFIYEAEKHLRSSPKKPQNSDEPVVKKNMMANEINLTVTSNELKYIHDAIELYLATISRYPEYEEVKTLFGRIKKEATKVDGEPSNEHLS